MRSSAPLGVLAVIVAVSSADAATITGTVKGPDGAPARGIFVQARQAQFTVKLRRSGKRVRVDALNASGGVLAGASRRVVQLRKGKRSVGTGGRVGT